MIDLSNYGDTDILSPGTIFQELDASSPEEDFDISFLKHMVHGHYHFPVVARSWCLWEETVKAEVYFKWDVWHFTLQVFLYDVHHQCPSCRCTQHADLQEPIREMLEELVCDLL